MIRLLAFICLFVFGTLSTSAQNREYNVLNYGAKPDGRTLSWKEIQWAVNAAHQAGGGRVVVPEGRFLTGSIEMKSGVELHLEEGAVLLGSTRPEHYVKLNRWKALVIADGEKDISITGKGEIDGQGRQLALYIDSLFYAGEIDSAHYNFVERRPKYYLRPQLIEFVQCKNIEVKNVRLRNAACWVQTYQECENIVIDSVYTDSDAYWNNDGIDIQDCKNVRITNCFVNAADDGICLKSHSETSYCDSIYIANCTVRSSASALKFGTRSLGGFKNVHIENIKVYDTFRSAIAIESVDGGFLENVLVENISAVNTGNAIFIRLGNRIRRRGGVVKDTVGSLKNVVLKNIKVEIAFERPDYKYDIRGPALPFFHNTFPSSITGIPGHPVENVRLENIEIRYPGRGNAGLAHRPITGLDQIPEKIGVYPEFSMFGELPAWGFYVRHMKGLTMKNIKLSIEAPDYRPALVFDDVQNLEIEALQIEGDDKSKSIILRDTPEAKIEDQQMVEIVK
ncbi:MAG: glycoside hydrolase family 28 protein [Bacteroidota bacterium]